MSGSNDRGASPPAAARPSDGYWAALNRLASGLGRRRRPTRKRANDDGKVSAIRASSVRAGRMGQVGKCTDCRRQESVVVPQSENLHESCDLELGRKF